MSATEATGTDLADVFPGDGEMSRLMRAHDWEATPLGSPLNWPESLRVPLRMMLTSRFEMWLGWGPDLRFFYNDAYIPTLGRKHPKALAEPARKLWAEIADEVGPLFDTVMVEGRPTWNKAMLLLLERNGYPEETYHTFSYSPLLGDQGRVEGLMCVVTEETERVIGERRLTTLHEMAAALASANSRKAIGQAVSRVFQANQRDFPFSLYYLFDEQGAANFQGAEVKGDGLSRVSWPLQDILAGRGVERVALSQLAPGAPAGAWAASPKDALLVPVSQPGQQTPLGALVLGLNPHRPADKEAPAFAQLIAAQIAGAVGRVDAFDAEKRRADRVWRLFDSAPGFLTVLSGPEMRFEFVNESYSRIFGGRDFMGKTVREAFPDLEGQVFQGLLDQVYATGERFVAKQIPVRLQPSPDVPVEERVLDFVYEAIVNDVGQVTGIFCEGYDVTDQHGAWEALRHSEASLRALNADLERQVIERSHVRGRTWQLSPDLLSVMNPDGHFESVNPAWTAALGWTAEDLKAAPYAHFVHPDDIASTAAAFEQARRGLPVLHMENRYRTRAGEYRWLSWIAVPDEGRFYCRARDITLEKEQAAALTATQEALRQSQKLEAMGQLTGGVAHDFNNLLTPILGSLDMLQRRGVGGDREQRLIDGALQSAERAKTLVQRLLAFSRRQPLQPSPVDIAVLVSGMAELVASTSGPQVRVVVQMPENLPAAMADPNQLEMAILNLSVNARDAMPDGGVLTISATRESVRHSDDPILKRGHYVRISVADTGVGMDEATLNRAIEPFFSTKGVGKGTGLGLSMAHGLASQLGGALVIASKPGLGTEIQLWLPVSQVAAEAARQAEVEAPSPEIIGAALLVDDEELVRASTADMLLDLGFEVVEATSAEDALKLIDQGLRPDVVITDHLMPGKTGVDLARDIRERRPGTPILLVSGYAEGEGVAPDLPRLTKPFRQADLAAVLASVMPHAEADAAKTD